MLLLQLGINLKMSGHVMLKYAECTVQPGYNEIGLYDIPPITSDTLQYQLTLHC